jgi:pimeloyl-ACP methyl ester carboxylesterase
VHTVDGEFGARLHAVESGVGAVVVLVPGWTMAWTVFERQLPLLAQTHRVVAFDPRGQGRSSTTFDGNTFRQHGRDLECVVDALGVHQFSLVAWSLGGFAAYSYLERAGTARVDRVVIIDQPPLSLVDDLDSTWGEFTWASFREFADQITEDRTSFAAEFVDWLVSQPLDATDRDWLTEMHLATTTTVALTLAMDGMFRDYTTVAEKLDRQLPVLQIVRDEDLDTARAWVRQHTPNARVGSITSHMAFWEDAATFNDLLIDFLTVRPP